MSSKFQNLKAKTDFSIFLVVFCSQLYFSSIQTHISDEETDVVLVMEFCKMNFKDECTVTAYQYTDP